MRPALLALLLLAACAPAKVCTGSACSCERDADCAVSPFLSDPPPGGCACPAPCAAPTRGDAAAARAQACLSADPQCPHPECPEVQGGLVQKPVCLAGRCASHLGRREPVFVWEGP